MIEKQITSARRSGPAGDRAETMVGTSLSRSPGLMRSDSYHSPGPCPVVRAFGLAARRLAIGRKERRRQAARSARLMGAGVSRASSSLTRPRAGDIKVHSLQPGRVKLSVGVRGGLGRCVDEGDPRTANASILTV